MHLLVCHSICTTILPSVYLSIFYWSLYRFIILFVVPCCSLSVDLLLFLSIIQFFVCSVCHSMCLSIYYSILLFYRFLILSVHSVHHSIHHSISPSLNYRHEHVYTSCLSLSLMEHRENYLFLSLNYGVWVLASPSSSIFNSNSISCVPLRTPVWIPLNVTHITNREKGLCHIFFIMWAEIFFPSCQVCSC